MGKMAQVMSWCGDRCWKSLLSSLVLAASASAQGSLFVREHSYPAGPGPFGSELAHLNGDALLDLAVADYYTNTVSLYRGHGDGRFASEGSVVVGAPSCSPRCVEVADFNGDGLADLATANASTNSVGVLLATGSFAYSAPTQRTVGQFPVWIQSGDLDNDGDLDLVCASQGGAQVSVLLGNGQGAFGAASSYPLGASAEQMRLGDLNGDGVLDLVVCSWLDNTLIRKLGNGVGGFGASMSWFESSPKGVALGDVDADGRLDVVTCSSSANRATLRRGTASGLSAPEYFQVGSYATSVELADVTGEGVLDIVTSNAGSTGAGSVTVLYNAGGGVFDFVHTSPISGSPYHLSCGDLNGDGRADAVATRVASANFASLVIGEFGSWERYCTAKVNSLGCTPHIHGRGTPSASNVRPFYVEARTVISFTQGLCFYSVGTTAQSTPFQGGYLCMNAAGIRRTLLANTGGWGEPGQIDCTGTLVFNFNAFAAGLLGGAPDPALQTAGVRYLVQAWTRDPLSTPHPTNLSDALRVEIGP